MSKQTAALHLESKNLMGQGMRSAAAQVDRFAPRTKSAAKSAHASISGIGDRVTALGRANASFMIGLGAIGAAGFALKKTFDIINAGLKPAEELESAMSGVKAVMASMTDKSMIPQLREQAIALAGAGDLAFFTAVQVAGAQKMLIKSGMDANKTMKSVAATMAIAGAEEIALADAADFTTNIMSAFRLEANQSTDAANMLAQASRTSNTNITELADGAAQGAADFKNMGGSMAEFLALGGSLAKFGIKGGEFGTGIKAMGVSLAKLGEESRKGASLRNMLGIERSDIVDIHGNIDAIKTLALIGRKTGLDRIRVEDEFGKQTEASAAKAVMGSAKVTRILSKIFKQYQFGKIAILAQEAALGNVQKRVADYNKEIGLGDKGAAFDVMRDKLDNTEGSAIRLSSAWNTLLVNLGSPFLRAKRGVLDYLTEILNVTNALATGNFKEFFKGAGEKVLDLATVTTPGGVVAKNLFNELSKQFGGGPESPTKEGTAADKSGLSGKTEKSKEVGGRRLFGKTEGTTPGFFNPVKPEETAGKSETNIILTGNNEFYSESLENEVLNLATVSFGHAQ